jgi:hypothetical protein
MDTIGAPNDRESMLIEKEQEKWRLFAQGDFATIWDLYTDDFINIGWTPTGMVRQNKQEAFDVLSKVRLDQAEIALTDFHVVHVNDRAAIVTYKVAAPFATLFASSVWAERDGDWKTVFYQASTIQ